MGDQGAICRLGVFYDGSFFSYARFYYYHERQLGWKNFRVLIVTTDHHRMSSMIDASRQVRVPRSAGPSLFLFAAFGSLRAHDPLACEWANGDRRTVTLT